MTTTLILMTALVPTMGHADLIEFAASMPGNEVHVLLNGRSFEPVAPEVRRAALAKHFAGAANVTVHLKVNDGAPQNPGDHPEFWAWWRREVEEAIPSVTAWDFVVASERYGLPLAEALGATFMPYDLERELNPVRGTAVRGELEKRWLDLIPAFREAASLQVVLFGQESVGKSTFAKLLAEDLEGASYFEFARPYLEEVHPTVDARVMDHIHRGQVALQRVARSRALRPLTVYDTDLFSTVGYWAIMREPAPPELVADALALQGDVYYLLPDDLPVERDPIRYAGDERESPMELWVELLERYNLPWVQVPRGTLEEKYAFLKRDVEARLEARWGGLKAFYRG